VECNFFGNQTNCLWIIENEIQVGAPFSLLCSMGRFKVRWPPHICIRIPMDQTKWWLGFNQRRQWMQRLPKTSSRLGMGKGSLQKVRWVGLFHSWLRMIAVMPIFYGCEDGKKWKNGELRRCMFEPFHTPWLSLKQHPLINIVKYLMIKAWAAMF
jgi:hypothetical protein